MIDWIEQRVYLVGSLLCALFLAYFYMLDRVIFSSAGFAYIFQFLLTVYDTNSAWLSMAVCLLAAAWTRPAPVLRVVEFISRHPVAVSAAIVPLAAAAALGAYHNYPLCMDEYAAVFQSKLFAAGHLYAEVPPSVLNWFVLPGANGSFFVASTVSGRVIEGYWPGFALLLAPFQWLGVPWLCNPLLAGLALYLTWRITLTITGERAAAAWALLFAAASSAFFINSISYYSMQAHLTANLLFAWLLLRPTVGRCIAAGFVGSLALVLHNPFPHVLFAAPWILAMLLDKTERRYLPALIAGYLPLALSVGVGWLMLRASIASATHQGAVAAGIVKGVFGWPTITMMNMRIAALAKLWIWSVPCLLLFALIGAARYFSNRHVRLFAASAVLTFTAYWFVSVDQGHGWGYRYFHSAWGALPILAACALAGRSQSMGRLVSFAGASAILSLLFLIPFQIHQVDTVISRHLDQLPAPSRPGNNVYFIVPNDGFYLGDMIQFDPLLRSPDLLLLHRNRDDDERFVRSRWPGARRINGGYWGEQWNLGQFDQRVSIAGEPLHFVIQP